MSAHLSRLDDPDDHLAMFLHGLEGRSGRRVVIILDRLDLTENLVRNSANLKSHTCNGTVNGLIGMV